jgi:outer membrane protein assembly factor BamE (lipoprotein component of BamABCDE complex)
MICFITSKVFKLMRPASWLMVVLSMATLCMFTSCVMVPIPVSPETITGTDIQEEATKIIQTGVTTRQEIVERFGEPDWVFDDIGIIAYC